MTSDDRASDTSRAPGRPRTARDLNSFPRIPVTPETATLTGILTALGAAVITLIGATLGGMAGMRYHRKVDRVGLGR
ncbi:hypothetical protein [Microbacterium enclense]|uniref:hypothetical protein n=1 Tax=Microbacterium enclense TaxID=993073 RepID=UPI0034348BB2